MLEKQPISNDSIIGNLKAHYNIKVLKLEFLPLGADANASVYRADGDGKSYFVKLKKNYNHEISIAIAKLLWGIGLTQVILPIKTLDGQFSQALDGFTMIVYPFIEGQDGFSRDLTHDQWVILGRALRQIHELDVPLSIQKQIRKEEYSPKWRQSVRVFLAGIETQSPSDEMAAKFLSFTREKQEVVQRLVNRSEELSQKLKELKTKFVLCHADIHGGNVLIEQNNSIYIVDWDDPMMAPKERDLMFIGGAVANVWNKPHEEESFYEGYGKTEVNREMLAYYRHERIVEDIALYSQELLSSVVGKADKQQIYKWFTDMFCPMGVVDMAFKIDEGG